MSDSSGSSSSPPSSNGTSSSSSPGANGLRDLPVLDGSAANGPRGEELRALSVEDLRKRLSRVMLRTVVDYGLIEDGDRLLVAVSGGKDSYTLLDLLWRAKKKSPVKFDLIAFHLDQQQPGYDGSPLRSWLEDSGIPFRIHSEDTYTAVKALTGGNDKTFCAPCSRLRRGILYTWAERLECNKIVLGHHREDTLETLLLNLLYSGKLQAMPASYRTNDDRFDVIRPLIQCSEEEIALYAKHCKYPILPCNLCGSQEGLKREKVADLLKNLERELPDVRQVMMAALRNVRPTHLLDREVTEAWVHESDKYEKRR
ncbi:MAG: tRNA 2-thiocytidine(32) synthetase TtcA [Planctomycetota bacterium]